MTDASLSAVPLAAGDFRLGQVIAQTNAVLRRNFPRFFLISALANVPVYASLPHLTDGGRFAIYLFGMMLMALSQAIVLHGAFQDMQGQPVDLAESARFGLRRFLPVVGVAFVVTVLGFVGIIALLLPGVFVFTNFFVATPACVVEHLGVFSSMRRSANLVEGHRWKIFACLVLLFLSDAIAETTIDNVLATMTVPTLAAHVLWGGIWGAFSAILGVVTYHDLRVAKEGVDTRIIAAVFA